VRDDLFNTWARSTGQQQEVQEAEKKVQNIDDIVVGAAGRMRSVTTKEIVVNSHNLKSEEEEFKWEGKKMDDFLGQLIKENDEFEDENLMNDFELLGDDNDKLEEELKLKVQLTEEN